MTVDGRPIARPKFSATGISWSERTANGYSAGVLRLAAHGAMLGGFIAEGPDETAEPRSILLTVEALSFTTEVCAAPGQTPQIWEPGPPFAIQIDFETGVPVATGTIGDGLVDPANLAVLAPTGGGAVPVQVGVYEWVFDAWSASYPAPNSSAITISFDGTSFAGTMIAWTSTGPAAAPIGWRGTMVPASAPAQALGTRAAPVALAALADADTPLSLADLVSLDTDGAADIAKQKFQDFVVYAMNDDWRTKLTSAPKPTLTANEIAALNQNLDYYTGKVCDPFLLQLLSKVSSDQGGPSTPIGDADKLNLRYFWESRLATKAGYSNQSALLTQLSYEEIQPRIALYANDSTTRWGQKLFDAWTTPAALTMVVIRFLADGNKTTTLDRDTELLLALAPASDQIIGGTANPQPCTLATLYHAKAMAALAQSLARQVGLVTPAAEADLAAWIPAWLNQLDIAIADGLTDPTLDPVRKAELLKVQADIAAATAAAGNQTALANQIATGLAAAEGTTMLGKLSNWLKTSKWGMGLNKAVGCATYAFALFQVINAFRGWDTLTAEQRAETITSAVVLGVNLIADIGEVVVSQIIPRLMADDLSNVVSESVSENLFEGLDLGHNYFVDTTERLAQEMAEAEAGATEAALGNVLTKGAIFMKGFAVLTAAAAVAFSTYQLYEAFDHDGTTADKVLDTLILAANLLVLASAVAAATVGECMLAAAGPFGAVAGLILMLVVAFLPRKPPTPPADDYMNQTGSAVLAGLDPVPAGWPPAPPTPAPAAA